MQQPSFSLHHIGQALLKLRGYVFLFHWCIFGINIAYIVIILSALIPYSIELPTAGQFFIGSLFLSFLVEGFFERYVQNMRLRVRMLDNYVEQLKTLKEVAPKEASYLEGPIYRV